MAQHEDDTPSGSPATPPGEPTARTYLQVVRQAADLAVAAADTAMNAVCRSRSSNTARLNEIMHATHKEAVEAEDCARRAAQYAEGPEMPVRMLLHCAEKAVGHAVLAQVTAGVEVTATDLRTMLHRPPTTTERAELESTLRLEEAREEAEARAATGMDSDNRRQADRNRYLAEEYVPELGWTAGHVRVLEAAASGRLYWRDGQARQAAALGAHNGGRRVSRERTQALHAARFLLARRQNDGSLTLVLSPMGRTALELARLHPAGLHPDDRTAYETRHTLTARRWMSSDEKKAAARRLPPLGRIALRGYRRPVTLIEQENRSQSEAVDQWEDEGGHCPGVEPPRPVGHTREQQARHDGRTVIRRPQRVLTPEEHEIVRDTAALNFQGGLIMGIIDPVPNPSPMSEDEGTWVREQVWPAFLTEIDRKYPFGFWRWAMCERGTCWNCLAKRCDLCVHRQEGGPHVDDNIDWVHSTRGRCVAKFIVRADDAPCVWWCRCPCAKDNGPTRRRRRAKPTAPTKPDEGPATMKTGVRADRTAVPRQGHRARASAPVDETQYTLF